jgi:hypothetical protein
MNIVADNRMKGRVSRRGDRSSVFAWDRVNLVAEGYGDPGPFRFYDLADAPLVSRIDNRPEQTNGDCLDRAALEVGDGLAHVLLAKRRNLVPKRIDAPADLACAVARHKRIRIIKFPIEGPLARCLAQREDIRMAFVADQPDRSDLVLYERICGHGGAMDQPVDLAEEVTQAEAIVLGRNTQHIYEAPLELARGRGRLEDLQALPVLVNDQVGKGATDVDASAVGQDRLP